MSHIYTSVVMEAALQGEMSPPMMLCLRVGFLRSPKLETLLLTRFLYLSPVSLSSVNTREGKSQGRMEWMLVSNSGSRNGMLASNSGSRNEMLASNSGSRNGMLASNPGFPYSFSSLTVRKSGLVSDKKLEE